MHRLLSKLKDRVDAKAKMISFIHLTVATAKQSTLVILNGLFKITFTRTQRTAMNCTCEENEIAKHCWEKIITFAGIKEIYS